MPTEIERKFLVLDDGWRESVLASYHIVQGYLGGDRCSVRVRIQDESANINIKGLRIGPSRPEYEYAIPLADAERMLASLCTGASVEKVRHHVEHAGHRWEVDEFRGANAGLVVAEIELDAEDEPFERPPWAGDEVTEQERYYNVRLSVHPYSEWSS